MLHSLLSCAWLRPPSSAEVCFWIGGCLPLSSGGAVLRCHVPCPAWVAPSEGHHWTPRSVLCWWLIPKESKAEQAAPQETLQNASVNGSEWVPCFALKLPLIDEMLLEFHLEVRGQYLTSSKKKTSIACSRHFAAKITSFASSIYDWETTTAVCCTWVMQWVSIAVTKGPWVHQKRCLKPNILWLVGFISYPPSLHISGAHTSSLKSFHEIFGISEEHTHAFLCLHNQSHRHSQGLQALTESKLQISSQILGTKPTLWKL